MLNYIAWGLVCSISGHFLGTSIETIIYKKKSNKIFNNGFFVGLTIGVIRAYTGKPIAEYIVSCCT